MHRGKKGKERRHTVRLYSFKSVDINFLVDKLNEMGQSSETNLYKYENSVYDEVFKSIKMRKF